MNFCKVTNPSFNSAHWLILFCFWAQIFWAQDTYTLSGTVKDAATGEDLIGATVYFPKLEMGSSTNQYGFYSITVPAGRYEVLYNFIGYQAQKRAVNLRADQRFNVSLLSQSTALQEVEVTGKRADANVRNNEMSVAELDAKTLKKVPQLLGENDLIRTLTLLPGITTVGEGSSGFNVRGGNSDQNLILLDEAPVYNSSHLFGFFSIFNADAVKDVKVYKGGIPARYGGRLSSVVDVRQKEGNSKAFSANGGIGVISSRVLVESPIIKDRASFMVAGRRSYADVFIRLSDNPEINQNIVYFYDLNTKFNYKVNENNRLFLSGYFGRDVLAIQDQFGFDWGNGTGTLRWNHLFSDQLFANFSAVYSDYNYSLGTPDDVEFAFKLGSRIRDYHLKGNFEWYPNPKSQVQFGAENIYYIFDPGKFSGLLDIELQQEFAMEPSLYISHQYEFTPRFKVRYGLRYSSFYNMGAQKIRLYQDPNHPNEGEVIDSTRYNAGEIIKGYDGWQGLEPRLSLTYLLNENNSFKLSYNRMRQYIHLISNTTSPTPVDVYRPAGQYIEPATVHQGALGYFQNFDDNQYEFSIESYYKKLNNVVDYRAGANIVFTEYIETELLSGEGRSAGLEFLLRKNKGKFTGWIAYTLSRTELRVESPVATEVVNNGTWYPANFDKPHDLSIVLMYALSKKWELGATFVYQTGRPISVPTGRIIVNSIVAPVFDLRNNGRIADYHRLDISATYHKPSKPNKKLKTSINFGVYNAYGRNNPFSVTFREANSDDPPTASGTVAEQLSLFAGIIPYITWNFKF